MARARIELTALQQQQVEKAFRRGDSNNRISCTLGVSQKVWERALRERMGDEAFEAQMATNLKANRRLGRGRRGERSVRDQLLLKFKLLDDFPPSGFLRKVRRHSSQRSNRSVRVTSSSSISSSCSSIR